MKKLNGKNGNRNTLTPKPIVITFFGYSMIGKSSLLYTLKNKEFPRGYIAKTLDPINIKYTINDEVNFLVLQDSGENDYQNGERLAECQADCIVICFSINNRKSFTNIEEKWIKWINENRWTQINPKAFIILLGTKSDSRRDALSPITAEEANELKNRIKAKLYLECSAKNSENLNQLLEECINLVKKKNSNKICNIL